jgi:hypothetical protein
MISTVVQQKQIFSHHEIQGADHARVVYQKLGRPVEEEFQHISSVNFLWNCPVTAANAKRALVMYGPNIATLKGKTTRTDAVERVPCIPSPVALVSAR